MVGDARARCSTSAWSSRSTRRVGLLPIVAPARDRRCRRGRSRATPSALNVFGFFAVALLERLRWPKACAGRRPARAGVDADRRPAGVQPARHRQPDRAAWRRPTSTGRIADVQPRRRGDHRRSPRRPRSAGRSPTCCSCRRRCATLLGRGEPRGAQPRIEFALSRARRPRTSRWPDARAADDAARRDRLPLHVPGRHRPQAARARGARCSSGWPRSARWRPASRTRSATRWRRCPARCRSCGRSCR